MGCASSKTATERRVLAAITQAEAERYHRTRGSKVYVVSGPPEARGIWVGSWSYITTTFPKANGQGEAKRAYPTRWRASSGGRRR